jgi:hypothetical protein
MRAIWRWMLTATAVVLVTSPARAQHTPRGLVEVHEGQRRGFWAGLSIGAGGEAFDLRDGLGYSDELYRPTVSLRAGGTVGQHLRLGGEVLAWINDHDDVTESLSTLLFIAQFYPLRSTGLYLKGGLGLGRNEIDFHDGFAGLGDTGFAGLVGAGWEVRLGRRFYLNPAVDLVEHRYTGRGVDRYRERLINIGMGVLFQSGR